MSFFLGHPLSRRPLWQRLPRMGRFVLRLLFAQEGLLFQPRPDGAVAPRDLGLAGVEVELPGARRVLARGWWVPGADAAAPAVLYLPGAAGNLGEDLATLRFLHGLGAAVLAFDYPGFGRSPGRPRLAACERVAEGAWTMLGRLAPAAARRVVYGRSFGCFLATRLAAAEPAAGLIFHNGFSSLDDFVARVFPRPLVVRFCRFHLDSGAEIGRCLCPALFLHAGRDEVVAAELGRRVFARAAGPRRFLELPGGHFGADWQRLPQVRQAFRELLAGEAVRWERPAADRG